MNSLYIIIAVVFLILLVVTGYYLHSISKNKIGGGLYDITDLFNNLRSVSCKLKSTVPNFDGKNFWSPIKDQLKPYDNIQSTWTIPQPHPELLTLDNAVESQHFFRQLVAIPTENPKPTLRFIMQIALNIGQAQGYMKSINNNAYYDKLSTGIGSSARLAEMSELSYYVTDLSAFEECDAIPNIISLLSKY